MNNDNVLYKLLKDYEDPNGKIYKGTTKTVCQWLGRFVLLNYSDFEIKKNWFEKVEEKKYKIELNSSSKFFTEKDIVCEATFLKLNKSINESQIKQIEHLLNSGGYTDIDLLDCVSYIVNNIINNRSRVIRCMTPIQDYIEEWKEKKK